MISLVPSYVSHTARAELNLANRLSGGEELAGHRGSLSPLLATLSSSKQLLVCRPPLEDRMLWTFEGDPHSCHPHHAVWLVPSPEELLPVLCQLELFHHEEVTAFYMRTAH